MMMPWEEDNEIEAPGLPPSASATITLPTEHPAFDPFVFVRLRIAHGATVKYVGIRADDTDITGEIAFDNGSVLTVKAWGVPTQAEPFMRSTDVMKEIQNYVQQNGLNLR